MGDPTDRPKNSEDSQDGSQDGNLDEDNLDIEAEQIEPARNGLANGDGVRVNVRENQTQNGTGSTGSSDTVASILTSISNPEAAVVIPFDNYNEGDAEYVDPDRIEKFYSGALTAITKVCPLMSLWCLSKFI